MKTNAVIRALSSNEELLNKFIKYYSNINSPIDFNSFIFYNLDIQLGILLRFFEDKYNICICATCSFYYITYSHPLKDKEKIIKTKTIYLAEWNAINIKDVNETYLQTYEMAIIKAIDLNQIF